MAILCAPAKPALSEVEVVVFDDDSVGRLIVRADEDRRLTTDYTFDSASIAVVDKVCARKGGRLGGRG